MDIIPFDFKYWGSSAVLLLDFVVEYTIIFADWLYYLKIVWEWPPKYWSHKIILWIFSKNGVFLWGFNFTDHTLKSRKQNFLHAKISPFEVTKVKLKKKLGNPRITDVKWKGKSWASDWKQSKIYIMLTFSMSPT